VKRGNHPEDRTQFDDVWKENVEENFWGKRDRTSRKLRTCIMGTKIIFSLHQIPL
jgi:hypothetical protein